MKIVNKDNIALVLAAAVIYSDYDLNPGKKVVSATTLIRPVKQIVKTMWGIKKSKREIDVSSYLASFIGSSVHGVVEYVWTNPKIYKSLMKTLGYSKKSIKNMVVNPKDTSKKYLKGKTVIFVEKRSEIVVKGYTISGKFDYTINGKVHDLKSTSCFAITKVNTEKERFRELMSGKRKGIGRVYAVEIECPSVFRYVMQGSIYKVLNPNIITGNTLVIQAALKDWVKFRIDQPYYPQSRLVDLEFELFSKKEVKQYMKLKIASLIDLKSIKDEDLLPECSSNDLWQSDSQWKYYSKEGAARATRNFKEDASAAFAFKDEKGGVGVVKEIQGTVRACNYCPHIDDCKQADRLESIGLLVKEK